MTTVFPAKWDHLKHVQASVELVTPEEAMIYLGKNFETNREKSNEWISELIREMKNDLFEISTDSIGFDINGRLVNGQHRLTALVESGIPEPFVIVRGLPHRTAQLIDVGKKRTMAQRITIGGTVMTEKQCAAIRNAIVDYDNNEVGTVAYAKKIHDKFVERAFCEHSDYLSNPRVMRFEGKGSSFWAAAALRMYAQMIYKTNRGHVFPHGMNAFDRSIMWLELTRDGMTQEYTLNPQHDNAAIVIRNMKEKAAVDGKGNRWTSKPSLRMTLCAAFNFMNGISTKTIRTHSQDPFMRLLDLPSTNQY